MAWRRRTRALRDKQEAETGQLAVFTRAGKAYSWGKGKIGGGSTALQEEYSSLPPLPLDATAVTQRGVVGAEAADAGGGPPLVHPWRRSTAAAHEKVGFMDRLGLVSLSVFVVEVGKAFGNSGPTVCQRCSPLTRPCLSVCRETRGLLCIVL